VIKSILTADWVYRYPKFIYQTITNNGNFVFTHAGIHPSFMSPYAEFNGCYVTKLNENIKDRLEAGFVDNYLTAGKRAGKVGVVGGLTWLDWRSEFEHVDGITQVVGHSYGDEPRINKFGDMCIDCNLTCVAIQDTITGIIAVEKI
jgi:hypothetical protein